MRRACLQLLLLSFGTCAPEQDREAYVRARKDGGWDAHCDAAYARLTGAAFSGLDAGVARRDVGATRECGRVRVAREGGGGDERAV